MKTKTIQFTAVIISIGAVYITNAQQGSVFDPAAHPASPTFESPYSDAIVPLDATLSWTERFTGDDNFNKEVTLGQSTNVSSLAVAGDSDHGAMPEMKSNVGMGMDAMGVIQQIKEDQGKLKIKHGPIERMGMPAMTMVFKVEDISMLQNLEKGNTVGFSVDNSSGGFVITHLMPMPADEMNPDSMATNASNSANSSGDMDARGTVKTIRVGQGKVKIEHGPIDRLGMPAMTMMFKVNDLSQFEGLEKGSTVDFSVDNSSGGFVITNIKPAQ